MTQLDSSTSFASLSKYLSHIAALKAQNDRAMSYATECILEGIESIFSDPKVKERAIKENMAKSINPWTRYQHIVNIIRPEAKRLRIDLFFTMDIPMEEDKWTEEFDKLPPLYNFKSKNRTVEELNDMKMHLYFIAGKALTKQFTQGLKFELFECVNRSNFDFAQFRQQVTSTREKVDIKAETDLLFDTYGEIFNTEYENFNSAIRKEKSKMDELATQFNDPKKVEKQLEDLNLDSLKAKYPNQIPQEIEHTFSLIHNLASSLNSDFIKCWNFSVKSRSSALETKFSNQGQISEEPSKGGNFPLTPNSNSNCQSNIGFFGTRNNNSHSGGGIFDNSKNNNNDNSYSSSNGYNSGSHFGNNNSTRFGFASYS